MKKIFLTMGVFGALFLVSCEKFGDARPVIFDVSVESTTFKVGDPVTFTFTGGDTDLISFYSGDVGNSYEYRGEIRTDEVQQVYLSFATHQGIGTGRTAGEADMDVLVSHDFNGEYNYNDIAVNGNFRVLPKELFRWSPQKRWNADNTFTSSGTVEITDYLEQGKPFYLAFRVISPALPAEAASSFRVRSHVVSGFTRGEDFVRLAVYRDASLGFDLFTLDQAVNRDGDFVGARSNSIFNFNYYGASDPLYGQELEQWVVSKKIVAGEITLPPDESVPLKQYMDIPLESHTHYYEYPGTYKVVFVATNATVADTQHVIKELEITIEE